MQRQIQGHNLYHNERLLNHRTYGKSMPNIWPQAMELFVVCNRLVTLAGSGRSEQSPPYRFIASTAPCPAFFIYCLGGLLFMQLYNRRKIEIQLYRMKNLGPRYSMQLRVAVPRKHLVTTGVGIKKRFSFNESGKLL